MSSVNCVLVQHHGTLLPIAPRGALGIARDAEAADFAPPPRLLRPAGKARMVGLLETGAQRALELADVVVAIGMGVIGHLPGLDEIQRAQFFRRDAELARAFVDQALEHIGRLRPPGAAIGVDGNRMGVNAPAAGVEVSMW